MLAHYDTILLAQSRESPTLAPTPIQMHVMFATISSFEGGVLDRLLARLLPELATMKRLLQYYNKPIP